MPLWIARAGSAGPPAWASVLSIFWTFRLIDIASDISIDGTVTVTSETFVTSRPDAFAVIWH
jgi:hypothetical protein